MAEERGGALPDLLVDVAAVLLNPLARVALTRQSRALRITPLSRLQAPRTSQLAASSQGGQSLPAPNGIPVDPSSPFLVHTF